MDNANSSYSRPKKRKNKNESKTDNLHNRFACIYIVHVSAGKVTKTPTNLYEYYVVCLY